MKWYRKRGETTKWRVGARDARNNDYVLVGPKGLEGDARSVSAKDFARYWLPWRPFARAVHKAAERDGTVGRLTPK